MEHRGVEYCCQCREYPCEKYEHIDDFDSFITHRNRRADLEKIRKFGVEAYHTEQMEKKTWIFYCPAIMTAVKRPFFALR